MEIINHRFWLYDFKVYYSAAENFMAGNSVYHQAYGLSSGFYKYSPFALLLFSPLALLPFEIAKVIYYLIVSGAIISIFFLLRNGLKKYFPQFISISEKQWPWLVIAFICMVHFLRELHLGNVNALILLVLLISIYFIASEKPIRGGILLGFVLLVKPHFVLLLILLALRKKFKVLVSSILIFIIGLFLPAILVGLSSNFDLLVSWKNTMIEHNVSLTNHPDTLFSWIYRFLDPNSGKAIMIIILCLIGVFGLLLIFWNKKKEQFYCENGISNFIFESCLIIALIPNLTLTDSEHFLFALPLISLLFCSLIVSKNVVFKVVAILSFVMYGGNWHDAVGSKISDWLSVTGILGIGNFLIILLFVFYYIVLQNKKEQSKEGF
jgi:hypothetical protein